MVVATIEARHRLVIFLLLGILAGYVALVFLPAIKNTGFLGFQGKIDGSNIKVQYVKRGSPADLAGMRHWNSILRLDGLTAEEWHSLYSREALSYLERHGQWRERPFDVEIQRDGGSQTISFSAEVMALADMLSIYGARLVFGAFLLLLIMVLALFGARDPTALLAALLMLFVLLWLFSGVRFWPIFMAPIVQPFDNPQFLAAEIGNELALQLAPSTMILIAMGFPRRLDFYQERPWLWLPVYFVPVAIVGWCILNADGAWQDRFKQAYAPRVWLNSLQLVLIVVLHYQGFRQCDSLIQKTRSRWVVGAMIIALGLILALWNVPMMLVGQPLISNFDWLLAPIALIPLALTMAMINHRLFGVRGLIRGRIGILRRMVEREKSMVVGRDSRIRGLEKEIELLKGELGKYTAEEKTDLASANQETSRMQQLLQRFPGLSPIREERLLGASPLWEEVFEQIAMASLGNTPVLITGESGTGKSDTARAIHALGDRSGQVYREISCSQFEHSDPAFALGKLFGIGAGHGLHNVPREGQPGVLQECDGGTLFLDDFDCLPRNVQDLLLYPLEGKPWEPGVGRGAARSVSIKFILATNRDLGSMIDAGEMRADLPARLGTRVRLPPLRDRREDIPVLSEHFIAECVEEIGHEISMISPRALRMLCSMDFATGNVRELKSELRRAIGRAMLENDDILRAGYLRDVDSGEHPVRRDPVQPRSATTKAPEVLNETDRSHSSRDSWEKELEVLRQNEFRIKDSEAALGFSQKSRALSNHLRGICIRVLEDNDWEEGAAARQVAGTSDPRILNKVRGKIRRYWKNIEASVEKGDTRRLFNNLPSTYHSSMRSAIDYVKNRVLHSAPD